MNLLVRLSVFFVLVGLVSFFVSREEADGGLAPVNRAWIDWLLANGGQPVKEPSVTFLKLDEDAFAAFEAEPPLTPLNYALLFSRLSNFRPKVAAVESILAFGDAPEISREVLSNTMLGLDSLLVSCTLENDPTGERLSEEVLSLFPRLEKVVGDQQKIPEFTGGRAFPDGDLRIAAEMAFCDIDLSDFALTRRTDVLQVPLLARHQNVIIPSLVLRAAMIEAGVQPEETVIRLGERIDLGDAFSIPIDRHGQVTVFRELRDNIPQFGADILIWDPEPSADLEPSAGGLTAAQRKSLSNHIVLIGRNDKAAQTVPWKKGEMISRAELFALAIATIQSGRFLEKLSPSIVWTVHAVLLALGGIILARKNGFILVILLIVCYFVGSILLFQSSQMWLPFSLHAALLGCLFLCNFLPRRA